MKRTFDHIRDRLHEKAGIGNKQKPLPPLEVLRRECWSKEFERLMRNRLIMGSFRYETWEEKHRHGDSYDYPQYITAKIRQYQETGNLECLVDAANGALLEFTFSQHPRRHFEATDDNSIHCQLKEDVNPEV